MKKIIHLSDIHVGSGNCGQRFQTIVDNLLRTPHPEDYVVVITGDLVDRAEEPNLSFAAEQLRRLKDRMLVFPVPGNHDVGIGARVSTKWAEAFFRTFYNSPSPTFPQVMKVDDELCLIGLFSTEDELSGLDSVGAEGELGERQLAELARILAERPEPYRVVCLHHHPFDRKGPQGVLLRLKDSDELEQVLAADGRVTALLFGHHHTFGEEEPWARVPYLFNAGSSTDKGGNGKWIKHRIIDLKSDSVFITHDFLKRPYSETSIA